MAKHKIIKTLTIPELDTASRESVEYQKWQHPDYEDITGWERRINKSAWILLYPGLHRFEIALLERLTQGKQ